MATKTKRPHALNAKQVANVTKWIKALRSGKYQQTTGTLRDATGYCCLGVACVATRISFDPWQWTLPYDGVSKLGLRAGNGAFDASDLTQRNDVDGWPFPRIADFIEQQLKTNSEGLFVRESA